QRHGSGCAARRCGRPPPCLRLMVCPIDAMSSAPVIPFRLKQPEERRRWNNPHPCPTMTGMAWVAYLVAVVFCALGALCVFSNIFSIPGAWIMLALAGIIEFCDQFYLSPEHQQTFGWWVLGVCLGLVALSEVLEFAAGAAGAKSGGASRRGMI